MANKPGVVAEELGVTNEPWVVAEELGDTNEPWVVSEEPGDTYEPWVFAEELGDTNEPWVVALIHILSFSQNRGNAFIIILWGSLGLLAIEPVVVALQRS